MPPTPGSRGRGETLLETPYLTYVINSFTLNSADNTKHHSSPEQSLSNTLIFSISTSASHLSNSRQHFRTTRRGHFKTTKSPTKISKMRKTWHSIYHKKGTCFNSRGLCESTLGGLNQEGRAQPAVDPSWNAEAR